LPLAQGYIFLSGATTKEEHTSSKLTSQHSKGSSPCQWMQAYSSLILFVRVNALLSASTQIFLRFAGGAREKEPQYESGRSLQRRDDVQEVRRWIVWNGFLARSISDSSNLPQGRQRHALSSALLHTSLYKIVFNLHRWPQHRGGDLCRLKNTGPSKILLCWGGPSFGLPPHSEISNYKHQISGFQVSGVRCQKRKTIKLKPEY
jgi:hypothetical protein